jgi:hypothetical protein
MSWGRKANKGILPKGPTSAAVLRPTPLYKPHPVTLGQQSPKLVMRCSFHSKEWVEEVRNNSGVFVWQERGWYLNLACSQADAQKIDGRANKAREGWKIFRAWRLEPLP